MRHPAAALAAAITLLLAAAPATFAAEALRPDGDAPAGAGANWLPNVEWVQQRWVPFDEVRLQRLLGMDDVQLRAAMRVPNKQLAQIAAERGVPFAGLARRLVGPRPKHLSKKRYRARLRRTEKVLTQPHLAEHVLFHVFHAWAILRDTRPTLGVPTPQFKQLYFGQRRSYGEIAGMAGYGHDQLYDRVTAAMRRAGRRGVRVGAMSERENRLLRSRDSDRFDAWFVYRVPPGHPGAQASAVRVPSRSFASFVCHFD